jgi:inorganic pyrophosphatase
VAPFFHPWHDLPVGELPAESVTAVIEIPVGSKNKYEIDKESGMLRLDRVLYSAVHYPANYGFLPRTFCEDGDALDILVLSQQPVAPLCIVEARPIGVITMHDEKGQDDKIIAVATADPEFNHMYDVTELSLHRRRELERFFLDYKVLENKEVAIGGMKGPETAVMVIIDAIKLYNDMIRR